MLSHQETSPVEAADTAATALEKIREKATVGPRPTLPQANEKTARFPQDPPFPVGPSGLLKNGVFASIATYVYIYIYIY